MAYKLEIKLKQETPMLHFQSDEPGAIIRGSDLKPRLDKFLEKKFQKGINGTKDYKVKIWVEGTKLKSTIKGNALNIAKTSNNINYKEILNYSSDINLEIICFNEDMLNLIEDNICAFFALHNFGRRQTKGFGSFTVSSINGVEINYQFKDEKCDE